MSLYNDLRPLHLGEVKGQVKVINLLKGLVASKKQPNAMLFVGERGTGKTTAARIMSRYFNCEHPTENGPCNECPSCKEALAEHNLDIVELDAASNNKVEDVHALKEKLYYSAYHLTKVMIVDEVHMLSTAAFNALLKIVEEPPVNCIFIFCTTEEYKVPATIISRCQVFRFEKIVEETIAEYLKEISENKGVEYDMEALQIIAKVANGGMRDALSIYEQFLTTSLTTENVMDTLGMATDESVFSLLSSIYQGNAMFSINILRSLMNTGINLPRLVKKMIEILVDVIYFIQSKSIDFIYNTEEYKENVKILAELGMTETKALSYVDALSELFTSSKQISLDFAIEVTLLKLIDKEDVTESLRNQVEELSAEVILLKEEMEQIKVNGVPVMVQQMPTQEIVEEVAIKETDVEVSPLDELPQQEEEKEVLAEQEQVELSPLDELPQDEMPEFDPMQGQSDLDEYLANGGRLEDMYFDYDGASEETAQATQTHVAADFEMPSPLDELPDENPFETNGFPQASEVAINEESTQEEVAPSPLDELGDEPMGFNEDEGFIQADTENVADSSSQIYSQTEEETVEETDDDMDFEDFGDIFKEFARQF